MFIIKIEDLGKIVHNGIYMKFHNETHARSIIKGLTWRIIASITTMSLVYWHTGNLSLTLDVGILDVVLKLLFYYLHERSWHKVNWGKYHKK